jgi:hypothetical protein
LTNIGASNGLLRQYFPKGTDLSRWSAEDLEAVALAINTPPARSSAGRPPPKSSRNSYARSSSLVLQRLAELAQYTSIAFTERLAAAGVSASVGTVGDAFDNALAESVIGLFKTELIKPRGPWHTAEQVEIATLEYVDWYNHRRLYEACGDIPPAELEAAYYIHSSGLAEVSLSTK